MKSQKGSILPIIILIILLAGIVITLSLTKQVNIFKSKADLNQIVFTGAGVSTQNGQLITDSPTVLVQVTSPNTFNSNSQVQGVSTSRKLLAQSNPDAGLPCSTSEGTGIYEADGSCTITAPSAPFPVSGDSCADGEEEGLTKPEIA